MRKQDCIRDCVGDVCEGCKRYITLERLAECSFKQWQKETAYVYEGVYSEQPESIKNTHRENALNAITLKGCRHGANGVKEANNEMPKVQKVVSS